MNKPLILYTALTKAVDDYNERHYLTRGHLADAIGFFGENAAIQFSNALNPLNHDKTLNDEKKYKLLHSMDHEAVKVFFAHYMKQFGLMPVEIMTDTSSTLISFHAAVDDVMLESDDVFKTTKMALKDEKLTTDEIHDIIKELDESDAANAKLRAMAKCRMEEKEGRR